jgi:hypothetical protein
MVGMVVGEGVAGATSAAAGFQVKPVVGIVGNLVKERVNAAQKIDYSAYEMVVNA